MFCVKVLKQDYFTRFLRFLHFTEQAKLKSHFYDCNYLQTI